MSTVTPTRYHRRISGIEGYVLNSAAIAAKGAAMKPGTKIEIRGADANLAPVWHPATIRRWNPRISGPIDGKISPATGWHVIRYDGGRGDLLCHESGFRVLS